MVEPTLLKNMLVKLDHFPKDRGENKKRLNHQPVELWAFGPRNNDKNNGHTQISQGRSLDPQTAPTP